MISPTAHRSASVVFGHGLLPGLRPVRLRFGYAAERGRVDRKRIQDKACFVITTRPPKRGRSKWLYYTIHQFSKRISRSMATQVHGSELRHRTPKRDRRGRVRDLRQAP